MHIITGIVLAALAGKKMNGKDHPQVRIPRFTTGPVQTIHAIPGRLRFRVPSLTEDVAGCKQVVKQLPQIQGVEKVAVTPLTGSVLIQYKVGEVEPEFLFAALVKLLDLEDEMDAPCRPALAAELRTMGESLNRAVYERTGGLVDLWTAMMIVLAGVGIHQMIRNPARAFPAGFTLVWWGINSMRRGR